MKRDSQKIPASITDLSDDVPREIEDNMKIPYPKKNELKHYQAELIKLQRHLLRYRKKMIILFDGRDASGKGGTIRRVTRYMNENHYQDVALGKPSDMQ